MSTGDAHLDVLDEHLNRLAEFDQQIQVLATELPVLLRKARARVRALRRLDEDAEPCARGADGRCDTHCPEN